jgi:hypothetical protein
MYIYKFTKLIISELFKLPQLTQEAELCCAMCYVSVPIHIVVSTGYLWFPLSLKHRHKLL